MSTVDDPWCIAFSCGEGRPQEKGNGQEEQAVRQEEDRWVEEEGRHQQAARQE